MKRALNNGLKLGRTEAQRVLTEIADMYDVPVDAVMTHRRRRPLPEVRQVFSLVMRERGYSCEQIAMALGLHYSSVIQATAGAYKRARYVADGIVRDEANKGEQQAA